MIANSPLFENVVASYFMPCLIISAAFDAKLTAFDGEAGVSNMTVDTDTR